MEKTMTAIEMSGTIDEHRNLKLDDLFPLSGPNRVRVIVMYPEDDLDEIVWQKAVSSNPAFDFLKDSREDIYTLNDGIPFDANK